MRTMTAAMQAAVQAGVVRPVLFMMGEFVSGPLYLWSGLGTFNWNGQNWLGVGTLGSVSPVQETENATATNIVMTLSGIPSDVLALVISEVRNGKRVRIWLGLLDDNYSLLTDPVEMFGGHIDASEIDEDAETSSCSITVENAFVDFQRARPVPFTDQAQQAVFPGDLGFAFVPQLADIEISWGVPGKPPTRMTVITSAGNP